MILFMNLSATALLDPLHDPDQLLLLLRWARWPASRTVLQLDPHEPIGSLDRLTEVVAAYRREGLRFACDNAGVHHSTSEILDAVRPEFVGIHRSLTSPSVTDAAHAIVEAAVAFARSTGAEVIANGIENQVVADRMQAMGIRYGQGFGLGEPTRAQAVAGTASQWAVQAALRPLRTRTASSSAGEDG